MNIEIKRSDLLHALAAADGIARPGNAHPLLECVLITATGVDAVTVAATDTAMTIRAELASKNTKPGSLAMNAKRLRDVIKLAPDESISIAALDNGWIEIKSGKAKYKLAALPGRDFPKVAEPNGKKAGTIDGDALRVLIDRVLFSTSDDKTRMHLNGASFTVSGGVASMTSSDGHRMSRATCSANSDDFTALVPKEALAKIAKLAHGDVDLFVEDGRMFTRAASVTMMTSLIDSKFPPIDQFLDAKRPNAVTVNRDALIASIERTKVATAELHGTYLDAEGGVLKLSSSHPDVGQVSDEIEASGTKEKVETYVSPKYLLEPLMRMSDEDVTIKHTGPLDPFVIEGANNYLALVMPMRRP